MPRKTKDIETTTDVDPEDIYTLQPQEDVQEFLDAVTSTGIDAYRSAYSDYDFDMDNYGYGDY